MSEHEPVHQLSVTVKVADDYYAGTDDRILISLNSPSRAVQLFDGPTRGQSKTLEIDITDMFGSSPICLSDLSEVYLYQEPAPHPLSSDAWKLESIILTVNGHYTNDSLGHINRWLDVPSPVVHPVWSGSIAPCAWRDTRHAPAHYGDTTYPVTWLPYIADLKSWRNYDPATIDGVGQLVGMRNGQLIGQQLKDRHCETLVPNGEHDSYTWVFTPEGAIIYRLWQHRQTADYVRHSQLGSGKPVVCAGEFRIERTRSGSGMVDMIAMVNDASGHYKPDGGACLAPVERKLRALGIPTQHISWSTRNKG
ncbi:hypothetical protein [Pseudomonas vanderleydeniana]|uniref:Uncharacterized protein n=1 Tax=Pseudomonas vanderleydeniana TaxID=2745495 RepID=A0A9E6TNZ6_9PSED|nr:hypothetical protein [Pseudomonas vanderleydeniana]QXI25888.1 hypothetical protein HU752_018145 [Pseudomonas vanderleydeniana]